MRSVRQDNRSADRLRADRARAGDPLALAELCERLQRPLFVHAYRMLGDADAAADALQESFAKAIAALPRTRPGLDFRPWMYRIVTNTCLRQLKRRRRLQELSPHNAIDNRSPEHQRRDRDIAELVQRALDRLPVRYKQLLLLREEDRLSCEDIAQAVGSTAKRVKVTVHRARRRFRAELYTEWLFSAGQKGPCAAAARMLKAERPRAKVVRHAESCATCRGAERRPLSELMILLPVVPETPSGVVGAGPAVSTTLTPLAMLGATLGLAGIGMVTVAATIGILAATDIDRPPLVAHAITTLPREAPVILKPSAPTILHRPATIVSPKPTQNTLPPPRSVASAKRARISRPARQWKRPALDLDVQFDPNSVTIARGSSRLLLRRANQLRLGDILIASKPVILRFGRDQSILFSGRLKLIQVGFAKHARETPIVEVLRGTAQIHATVRGGGIRTRADATVVTGDAGEYRVHRDKAIRVEAIRGHVSVRGRHVPRELVAGTSVEIDQRVSFAKHLPGRVVELKPTLGCFREAPHVSWAPAVLAKRYRITVARDASMREIVSNRITRALSATLAGIQHGKYFWQIVPLGEAGEGPPSKTYAFSIRSDCGQKLAHYLPRKITN